MTYNNIIFATEQEARSYLLPLASQMLFMDPHQPVFYVKTVDAYGQSLFEIGDFTLRPINTPTSSPKYITQDDLKAFKDDILASLADTKQTPQKEEQPNG